MLRTIISILFVGILFSSQCQYTQNIDSMSRREIRNYLLTQDQSKKTSNSIKSHRVFRTTSHVFYVVSGLFLLNAAASNDDLESIIGLAFGGISFGAALVFTILSEISYSDAVKKYKARTPLGKQSGFEIRDASRIPSFGY